MLKMTQRGGEWKASARICAPDGGALEGIRTGIGKEN